MDTQSGAPFSLIHGSRMTTYPATIQCCILVNKDSLRIGKESSAVCWWRRENVCNHVASSLVNFYNADIPYPHLFTLVGYDTVLRTKPILGGKLNSNWRAISTFDP